MVERVTSQRCAGAIVFDESGRLLVIQRRNPPSAGLWSIPGGRCLEAESTHDACIREAFEETGLEVQPIRLAGRIMLPGIDGARYDVDDFVCRFVGGVLHAGDDASDVSWVDRAGLGRLPTAPGLVETLHGWGCLPS